MGRRQHGGIGMKVTWECRECERDRPCTFTQECAAVPLASPECPWALLDYPDTGYRARFVRIEVSL